MSSGQELFRRRHQRGTDLKSSGEVYEAISGMGSILGYKRLAIYDPVMRPLKNCLQTVGDISKTWVGFNRLGTAPVEVCDVSRGVPPFETITMLTRPTKKKGRIQGPPESKGVGAYSIYSGGLDP